MNNIKRNIKKIFFTAVLLFVMFFYFSLTLIAAQITTTNTTTTFDWTSQSYLYSNYGANPTDTVSWTSGMCNNSEYMDFIVNIPLDSCSPAVVRSDLLEEQNVPVFCRLTGVKVNPLINVPYIKDIQVVQQNKPQEVLGITYYPPNAALSYSDYQYSSTTSSASQEKVLGVPTMSNLGYVLIMLKQQPNEDAMPKNVKINMTLKIFYDVAKTYGMSENNFVLPMLTENEWKLRYNEFSFWRGKGYLRLVELKDQTAKIAVYTNPTGNPIDYVTLKEGVQLNEKEILLPGFYCGAGVRLNLDKISLPQNRAVIIVDGNTFTVDEKDMIGDTGCLLSKINLEQYGYGGTATVRCQANHADLQITNLEADLTVGNKNYKVNPGEKISIQKSGTEDAENLENWYVGYIGKEYAQRTTTENKLVPMGVENIVILFNYTKKTATAQDSNNVNIVIKAVSVYLDRLHAEGGYLISSEQLLQGIKETNPSAWGILKKSENIKIIFQGKESSYEKINGEKVTINSLSGPIQTAYSTDTEAKYKSAIDYYKEISSKYPDTETEDGATYGLLALREAADLALKFNKEQDAIDLLNLIITKYESSEDAEILSDVERAKQEITSRLQISGQNSKTISALDGEHSFELIKFIKPGLRDISADLKINGISGTYTIGDRIGNDNEWEISNITEEAVGFRYIYSSTEAGFVSSKSKMIMLDPLEQVKIETTSSTQPQPTIPTNQIKVEFISTNVKKEATVSLDFESERTSVTNFSIGIGIEKRAIQLNPDQTKNLISKLDSAISTIDSINDKIGKLTTVWKKACLAGATALWVKNFAEGITGEGYARRKAMEPWIAKCSDSAFRNSLDKNNVVSISRCYQLMESKINSDVDIMEKALKETNTFIEKAKSGKNVLRSSGLLGTTKTINEEEFMKSAQEKFPEELTLKMIYNYKKVGDEYYQLIDENAHPFIFNASLLDYYKHDSIVSSTNLKDYMLELYLRKDCSWKNSDNSMICTQEREKTLYDKLSKLEIDLKNKKAEDTANTGLKDLGINQRSIQTISGEKNIGVQTETFTLTSNMVSSFRLDSASGYDAQKNNYVKKEVAVVQYIWPSTNINPGQGQNPTGAKKYLLILDPAGSADNKETFTIKEIYLLDDTLKISGTNQVEQKPPFGIVTKIDLSKCSKNVINADDASKIKFWETGSYAGLVSVMPISRESGYYLATKGPSALETTTSSWKTNGDINTYYICNVGTDKAISWTADGPTGDDASCCIEISSQVNLNNVDSIPVIPGQENNVNGKSESKRIIELAKKCSKTAIEKFSAGDRKITTDCGTFNLGKPLTAGIGTNCEEFMSPTDCKIMYNLCDPVMCPSSRCDYGGRYPVENVIQSGIIGSLLLCSPNFENGKGVLMPVCLSGLNAGLDALNSVLKSSKDCLNEQLASGKTIGICDQIMSLYLCELMWKELDPFIKSGIPSIVQSTTQKGGGEYALFSESWKSSIDSARFFTNYYGLETFNSFKARSTAEVSTEVCKKFASIAYPTQGQFFSELTTVDSPPQVFASFQEVSTGGVNGESQYKVYYHIYAGKDSGVFYSVYLKNPSSQGYYSVPETYYVKDSYGYLNKGEYKSATPDFTAPSGYKELCVRINDKDICGFGQATTDFALDEANNLYIESQLSQEITTANDCVSGTSGIVSLSLNIQQTVESTISPTLYKTGIVRICSSTNPGGTDKTRYTNVGYCDNTEIKCWLDTESVNNSISDLGIVTNILNNTIAAEIQKLIDSGAYKNKTESIKAIEAFESEYNLILNDAKNKIKLYNEGMEELYANNNKPSESQLKEKSEELSKALDPERTKLDDLEPKTLIERNKAFYPEERARADLLIAHTKELRAEMTGLLERFIAGRIIAGEPGVTSKLNDFIPFSIWPLGKKIIHCWEDKEPYLTLAGDQTTNKNVYAVGAGKVIASGLDYINKHNKFDLYYIIVSHENGLYSYYGALSKLEKTYSQGESIFAGQKIGEGDMWPADNEYSEIYFKIFKVTKGEVTFGDYNNYNSLCFFDETLLNKNFNLGCSQIKTPEATKSFLETSSICLKARTGLTINGVVFGGEEISLSPTVQLENAIIVIDPGHGGTDPGAVATDGTKEAGINLAIAQKVKTILLKEGAKEVWLTRENSGAADDGRSTFANNKKANLLISIHSNKVDNTATSGTEAWISCNICDESGIYGNKNYKQCTSQCQDDDAIYLLSKKIATAELVQITSEVKTKNLGIKEWDEPDSTYIQTAEMPAALIELGYLSNSDDLNKLKNNQDQFAEAISNGILDYFGEEGTTSTQTTKTPGKCTNYNGDEIGCNSIENKGKCTWWGNNLCGVCPTTAISCGEDIGLSNKGLFSYVNDKPLNDKDTCEKNNCNLNCLWNGESCLNEGTISATTETSEKVCPTKQTPVVKDSSNPSQTTCMICPADCTQTFASATSELAIPYFNTKDSCENAKVECETLSCNWNENANNGKGKCEDSQVEIIAPASPTLCVKGQTPEKDSCTACKSEQTPINDKCNDCSGQACSGKRYLAGIDWLAADTPFKSEAECEKNTCNLGCIWKNNQCITLEDYFFAFTNKITDTDGQYNGFRQYLLTSNFKPVSTTDTENQIASLDSTKLSQLKANLVKIKTELTTVKNDAPHEYLSEVNAYNQIFLSSEQGLNNALLAIESQSNPAFSEIISFKNKYYNNIKQYSSESDTSITAAIIYHESGGISDAISSTGCVGLGQLCYCTAWIYSDLESPYCANLGYSKTSVDIFQKLSSCNCGTGCNVQNAECNKDNDDRFDTNKNIHASALHFSDFITTFKSYTYKYEFAIASYNAGEAVIKKAIIATGKSNPTWDETFAQLTPALMRKPFASGIGYNTNDWTDTRLQNKIDNEIKVMVDSVMEYKSQLDILNTAA